MGLPQAGQRPPVASRMLYGFEFSGFDVRFSVDGDTLTVFDVAPAGSQKLK